MLNQYDKYKLLGLAIFSSSALLMITLICVAIVMLTAGWSNGPTFPHAQQIATNTSPVVVTK